MHRLFCLLQLALLAVASTVWCGSAAAATTLIYLDSPPGEYVGQGITRTFTPANGTFYANPSTLTWPTYGDGVSISFSPPDNSVWVLYFVAPLGYPLAVGNYELAQQFPPNSPTRPGLDVSGESRGCGALTGRFTVREISRDAGGQILSFAADFVQTCTEPAGQPTLRGVVRYKSAVPQFPAQPIAAPGPSRRVKEGGVVLLDGGNSYDLDGSITAYKWTQLAGPPVAALPGSGVKTAFIAPEVVPGGQDVVIGLEVTDNSGRKGNSFVKIIVEDSADPRSYLYLRSEEGDFVGRGLTRWWTADDGIFSARGRYFNIDNGIVLRLDKEAGLAWALNFAGIQGTGRLVPGNYPFAEGAASASAGHPGMDISGEARSCYNLSGSFQVLEAVYAPNNDVLKFAADFEQHCDGGPGLFGSVRFNSNMPGMPMLPGPPSIYRIQAANGNATVFFRPPVNNNENNIIGYTVSCSAPGQVKRSRVDSQSPITVSGLVPDVAYKCSVAASNLSGTGAASALVSTKLDLSFLYLLLLE